MKDYTQQDDSNDDNSCVLEQGVVEDARGEGGDVEDRVNESWLTLWAERRHEEDRVCRVCHTDTVDTVLTC